MDFARGNFIDNQWLKPSGGPTIRSVDPARLDEVVLEAPTSTAHAAEAVAAAARAWPAWAGLAVDDRVAALRRFSRELTSRTEALARAITSEMGKTIREARQEATGLVAHVDLVIDQQLAQVKAWSPPTEGGECRYHPLGVIGVIGPFNQPLHLCHAYIIPALATGNTVVVKPSERTPLAFQRYMEAWAAANMPPILNMVQGGADVGRALLQAPELRGVAFTGSWRVGHQIARGLVDRPEVLAALAMGGQNMNIVLEDADLDQALEGVLLGGYQSTGQRCTCTARVLVQRSIAATFVPRLVKAAKNLTFGDPMSDVFMGPMASLGDRDRVEALCRAGREAGAEVLLAAELRDGGAWRGPSLHLITPEHESDYTREEVFGPDLAVTIVDDLDHALAVVNSSPYGLSVGLFSSRRQAFDQVYLQARVGCVSWNRSTNRTLGALPLGGVGRSGNFRPAGSDAVRVTTYPVQVLWNDPGVLDNDPYVRQATARADPLMALEAVHRIEEALEPYGLYPDVDPSGASGFVKIPLVQLDGAGVVLSRPLVEHLQKRQIAAEIAEQAVRLPLPPGSAAPKALARALADALHAVRALHPARFLGRRPAVARAPLGPDGRLLLPRSQALVRRLVGAGPPSDEALPVLDLGRSAGPWLASVDDDPLVASSARAADVNAPPLLEALVQGRFGATPLDGGNAEAQPAAAALAAELRRAIGGAHPFVRFVGSRAEALEIAIATAAPRRPGRRAVVAPRDLELGGTLLLDTLDVRWLEPGDDDVEAVRAALEDALADDQVVAVVAPPGAPAAYQVLREVTLQAGVPLVLDEAPLPPAAGEPLFAHRAAGATIPPDVVTCLGRTRVGAVLSRWPIPVRTEAAATSIVRGAVRAQADAALARDPAATADRPWPTPPARLGTGAHGSHKLVRVGLSDWPTVCTGYEALQALAHEPTRRTDCERLAALVGEPDTFVFAVYWIGPQKPGAAGASASGNAVVKQGTLVAASVAYALEHAADRDGPRGDPSLGRGDTCFVADVVVHPDHRGQELARALREAQLAAAMAQRRPDGAPRFTALTTCHHGADDPLAAIDEAYGAWPVSTSGDTTYVRVGLTQPRLPPIALVQPWPAGQSPAVLDLEGGLERRLGPPQGLRPGNDELREHLAEGRLGAATINPLEHARGLTPGLVRAHEWLGLQAPKGMRHLILAAGRCEALERTLAALRRQRPTARTVLALGPVRAGMATAAARSLSLPAGDDMNWFGWPTLPDPTREPDKALLELKRIVAERGGDDVLAVVLEPVYHATGRAVADAAWSPLRAAADEHGLPLVLVENTTAGHRNGKSFWRADTLPVPVDAVVWYPGGQLGLGYVSDRYRPAAAEVPWGPGDELSLTRLVWELRVARALPIAQRAAELRRALAPLGEVQGEGLFLTIEHHQAESLQRRLAERGLRVGLEERTLRFVPPLNLTADDVSRVAAAVREVTP